jgi:GTPase SAR1 family protein
MGCCGSAQVIAPVSIAIGLFGLNESGKTCFLRSLQDNFDFDTIPTKTLVKATVSISNLEVVIYDFGYTVGLPASQWSDHFAGLWGFVFMIDGSNRERYKLSQPLWLEIVRDRRMAGKPFVIVSNKHDLKDAMRAAHMQSEFPGAAAFVDASAAVAGKGGTCDSGVTLAISILIGAILKRCETIRVKVETDLTLQPPPAPTTQAGGDPKPDDDSESYSQYYIPDA